MGQTGSNLLKKAAYPFRGWTSANDIDKGVSQQGQSDSSRWAVTPFVFKRTGSQYFDEDGDLAHEFYVQTQDKQTRQIYMRKLEKRLVPQGEVDLDFPRLNVDIPIVICESQKR